jgi:large subunit ribosomal protein L12e
MHLTANSCHCCCCRCTAVYVRACGGEAPNVSALAPKLGPMGLSPKTIGDGILKNTKDWKGLKITVQLKVQNRKAEVSVKASAAALVIKALKEPARDRKKVKDIKHDGNITLEDVYTAARTMRPRSMAATFAGTVKEILGSAVSVGCTVEDQDPRDIQQQIDDGDIECPTE